MADIRQWLESLGLGQYAEAFEENEITRDQAPDLTHEILKELGVTVIGHRMKLLKAAKALLDGDGDPATPAVPEAERRQLTVLFCDLVGSTALSEKLDPEELREVMAEYQKAADAAVERYGGHVAQYLGDGIVVYFGWPRAHERDAERAILAALETVEAVKRLDTLVELAVRVGIATGVVVVGEAVEADASVPKTAVGETFNLAARLQGLASPNAIVITALTKELVGAAFQYEDLAHHALKGFAEPVQAWGVLRENIEDGEFEAATARRAPWLIGRDEETGLLRRAWQQSREEPGQAVLINGEAGIGKSALIATLLAQVSEAGLPAKVFRCSPYHSNSALYPIIEQFKRAMLWAPDDTPEARLGKLERLVSGSTIPAAKIMPLFASLMSLPLPEARYPPMDLAPQQLKQQTLDTLVAWSLEEAERQATVLLWEDLHWADPSTLEFLALLLEQVPTAPLLLVMTFRPNFTVMWPARSHMTPITLNRLERPQAEALVKHLTSGKPLPEAVVEHIVRKTDGVPLYVEELTKAMFTSGVLREQDGCYELTGPLSTIAIPATLQESLMARLDQYPTLREVAQLGSVLGREFAFELLLALGLIEENALKDGLGRLVEAELLYQRGRPPHAKYIFKHALIQDAAYQSLLKRTRQQYHHQVAQLLEERFPEQVETEPEVLAFHYTGAGRATVAIGYWLRAGKRAVEQSANAEAIAHLNQGLKLLEDLAEGEDRARLELTLRIELVACMRILDRYDAALAMLDRAQSVATDLGRIEDLALIHNYRGNICFPLGKYEDCLEQHQLAAGYAREAETIEQEARALSGLADAFYSQGRMITARDHYRQCVDFCSHHGLHRIERDNRYMAAWSAHFSDDLAGVAEDAIAAIDTTLASGHQRAEIVARASVALVLSDIGDNAGARREIEAGLAVVEKLGAFRFKPLYAIAENRIGLAEGKPAPQLVAAMEETFQTAQATGVTFLGPWVLSSLALVSDNPERRRRALADGEELLRSGCVGHNYLKFYPDAIEISLAAAEWNEAERYCAALADFTRPEPLPPAEFYVAYGRTLAAFGRGARDDATLNKIKHLRDEAARAGPTRSIPQLDQALTEANFSADSPT
ncbi:MAG: AAA family ATPase [Proteobacteria bacterium]|nr:AAA family ATPase [Pseudomonadota bacterium]